MISIVYAPKMCERCGKQPAIAREPDWETNKYPDEPNVCAMGDGPVYSFKLGCAYLCDSSETFADENAQTIVAVWRMSGRL